MRPHPKPLVVHLQLRVFCINKMDVWKPGGGDMSSAGEYSDRAILLRSNSSSSDGDLERGCAQSPARNTSSSNKGGIASDLLKRLDRGLSGSGRRLSVKLRPDRDHHRLSSSSPSSPLPLDQGVSANAATGDDFLGDSAPPEWALLLIGCLLGVATGLCVAAFNRGVSLKFNNFVFSVDFYWIGCLISVGYCLMLNHSDWNLRFCIDIVWKWRGYYGKLSFLIINISEWVLLEWVIRGRFLWEWIHELLAA